MRKPFAQAVGRGVAQQRRGLGDIGQRMQHITGAEGAVDRRCRCSCTQALRVRRKQAAQVLMQLVQRRAFAQRHVVDLVDRMLVGHARR